MTTQSQHPFRDPETGLVPQEHATDPCDAGWGDGVSIIDAGVERVGYHDALIATITVAAGRAQALTDWAGQPMPGSIVTADRKWFAVRPGEVLSELAPQIVEWFVERGVVGAYAQQLVDFELGRSDTTDDSRCAARATALKIAGVCPGSVDAMLTALQQAANEIGSPAGSERRRRFDEARELAALFIRAHGPNSIADLSSAIEDLRR